MYRYTNTFVMASGWRSITPSLQVRIRLNVVEARIMYKMTTPPRDRRFDIPPPLPSPPINDTPTVEPR